MPLSAYHLLLEELHRSGVQLVAVSKTKSVQEIEELYNLGQRDFGENYVQELVEKQSKLPPDIHWHFIGHLQSNKVKYIAPFVFMIQSVDSMKLLLEIDKQAEKNKRIIRCLFQIHIAREETKFGLDEAELDDLLKSVNMMRSEGKLSGVLISGCMGMASLTEDHELIRKEFGRLHSLFEKIKAAVPADAADTLSMGMSSDYPVAIEKSTTMVRIGSLLFGERNDAHK
jgi:PLP dependent protein